MSSPEVKKPSVLEQFGTDYHKKITEGDYDKVIGREKEILRLTQILSRRKKNNPIILGFPGCGKSSILCGLQERINKKEVSSLLDGKRIIELDLAAMVAGTKYRGEFEARIKSVMNEVKEDKNIILFIDEVHTIIGGGSGNGTLDAANILKPALANGTLQAIGATTLDEYTKYIEKDGALERRFQKVMIDPSSKEETIEILQNNKSYYENHHNVLYSNEIIEYIVKLADRYIHDRYFPDKAIDILDEVGSLVNIQNFHLPDEIVELTNNVNKIKAEKEAVVKSQQYEQAGVLRDKEKVLLEIIEGKRQEWLGNLKKNKIQVSLHDVASVVSSMSNIPVTKLTLTENEKLLNLDEELKSEVFGQDKAVDIVVKAIKKSRLGIKKTNKPFSMLFGGKPGCGKTLLAKTLAKVLFNDKDALIKVNLSEYGDKISASRLIGAAPGYVGYEEGGELTKKIKYKPYSVILLDEIEKAHPDVLDILLQILDEGYITDSLGVRIDFRNTIIIMTSNIGSKKVSEFGTGVGFVKSEAGKALEIENTIKKELKKTLKAEFLNRISKVIVFNSLTKEDLLKVINSYIEKLSQDLQESYKLKLIVNNDVNDLIIKTCEEDELGARAIENVISELIEDSVTELILKGVNENSILSAYVNDGNIEYNIKKDDFKK